MAHIEPVWELLAVGGEGLEGDDSRLPPGSRLNDVS